MATYVFAGRVSEIVGRSCPGDSGYKGRAIVARGPCGVDVRLDTFKIATLEEPVALFKIENMKRKERVKRICALPLNPNYEPWTQPLYDYFKERKGQLVFPVTRQTMWKHSKTVFKGLKYPIERYLHPVTKKPVPKHPRDFRLHALRHVRATELAVFYDFTATDLSAYVGWTLQATMRATRVMARYISPQWRGYFPKLLKPRNAGA